MSPIRKIHEQPELLTLKYEIGNSDILEIGRKVHKKRI